MNILLSAAELEQLIGSGEVVVVDCRFELTNPAKGRADWALGHIPGAGYADLDHDLSSPIEPHTGRHPLPDSRRFAEFLATLGWSPQRLLVAYDDGSGAVAARLWWLMRLHGQPAAMLDGGLKAWVASGRPLETGEPGGSTALQVPLQRDDQMFVGSETVLSHLESPDMLLLDARAGERFRGANETLDSRAGHIPGSINRPFALNLETNGCFKSPGELREEFLELLEGRDPATVAHSCGSGVTACHNQFAMELAGLSGSRVYVGSWSEWIRDPARPVATGP